MNDKQVRSLVIITAFLLLLSGIILFYVFDSQGMSSKNNSNSTVVFDNYYDVYNSINVDKVTFKNIDKELLNDFLIKQDEIIGYIDGYYNQMIMYEDYIPVSTVSSSVKAQINGAILSVCYRVNFNLDENVFNDSFKSYVFAINIDLRTNKVLTKEDLLSKYNYSKSYIADKLFNDDVLIEKNEVVIDRNTNISLTRNDVKRKKEIYVNRIVFEFNNIIEIYIENDSLVLIYNTKDLKDIFFDNEFDTNIKIRYLK